MKNIQKLSCSFEIENFPLFAKEEKVSLKNLKISQKFSDINKIDMTISNFTNEFIKHITEFKNEELSFLEKKCTLKIQNNSILNKNIKIIKSIITNYSYGFIQSENELKFELNLEIRPTSFNNFSKEIKNYIFIKEEEKNSVENIIKSIFQRNDFSSYDIGYSNQDIKEKDIFFKTQYHENDWFFFNRLCQENNLYYYFSYEDNGDEKITIGEDASKFKHIDEKKISWNNYFDGDNSTIQITYPEIFSKNTIKEKLPHLNFANIKPPFFSSYCSEFLSPGSTFEIEFQKGTSTKMLILESDTSIFEVKTHDLSHNHKIIYTPVDSGIPRLISFLKPKILSSQFALVVGKEQEECSIDKNTLIAVKLFWKEKFLENENQEQGNEEIPTYPILDTIIHIPVGQNFGGISGDSGSCGSWFIPRVGQKAIVQFINGDGDNPIVVGTAYDEQNISPFHEKETDEGSSKLSIQTCTMPSNQIPNDREKKGHEFTFEDAAGKEFIFLSSSGHLKFDVSKETEFKIKNCYKTKVEEGNVELDLKKGNFIQNLQEGDYQVSLKKGKKEITLEEGNYTLSIKKGKLEITASDDIVIKAKNIKMEAEENIEIKGDEVKIESTKNLHLKSGASTTIDATGSFSLESQSECSMKGSKLTLGADIKFDISSAKINMNADGEVNVKGSLINLN